MPNRNVRLLTITTAVIITLCVVALSGAPVFAASSLTVVPSMVRLDLNQDKPEAQLFYTNTTKDTLELTLSASDVTYLEEGYKPSFLEKKEASNYTYRLSSWMSFDTSSLVVKPGETQSATVFINADRLTPGGHYGAVLAQIKGGDSAGNLQLRGVLSSLVFVRTATGKEIEHAKTDPLVFDASFFRFPSRFSFRFRNTGNVDLTPYGSLEVRDIFGNKIARGTLNEDSLITLPESVRTYQIKAVKPGFVFPSLFQVRLTGHYGKERTPFALTSRFISGGDISLFYLLGVVALVLSATAVFLKRKRAKSA